MSFFARSFATTLLTMGIGTAGALYHSDAFAANVPCNHSSAHEAFNVQGLKSELMVTALSCHAQNRYNDFVAQFRGTLLDEEKKLNGYFRSVYGRNAQRKHDDYITQLANVQSEQGLQSGTIFCLQHMPMFDETKVLNNGDDLSAYAEAKDVIQPTSFEVCTTPQTRHHESHRHAHHA
ncbi:MAG: hypothetical protein J6P29_06740 [Acetobacter sp.]|nr:hypothetical protein [Acetobacter sp.]